MRITSPVLLAALLGTLVACAGSQADQAATTQASDQPGAESSTGAATATATATNGGDDATHPADFMALVARAGMVFHHPAGFEPVVPVENSHWGYQHAVRATGSKLQLFYHVVPLDRFFEEQKECQARPGCTYIDPNMLHHSYFKAAAVNLSDGRMGELNIMPTEVARGDFGADWGAVQVIKPRDEEPFAGYELGLLLMLHRENVGDVMILALADDEETVIETWLGGPGARALHYAGAP